MTHCCRTLRALRGLRSTGLTAALVVTAFSPASGAAQTAPDTIVAHPRGWIVGVALGVPGYRRESAPDLFTLGVHATAVRPGGIGADLALGVLPRALAEGAPALGARAGVAVPIPLAPRLLLLPAAGASAVAVGAPGGAGGVAGWYIGGSAVAFGGRRAGVRVGATWHRFADVGDPLWLLEVELVWGPTTRLATGR